MNNKHNIQKRKAAVLGGFCPINRKEPPLGGSRKGMCE
jgi:hypothetical protein